MPMSRPILDPLRRAALLTSMLWLAAACGDDGSGNGTPDVTDTAADVSDTADADDAGSDASPDIAETV